LKTILNKHTEDTQEVLEAIAILKDTGSIDYARKFARDLVEKSWKGVEGVLEDGKPKESLRAFANYLIDRSI
jgi:geranylgeranyl pyrophosphate synthase